MYAVTPRSGLAAGGSWILRCPQQALCVPARGEVCGVGAKHPAELANEPRLVQLLDHGVCGVSAIALMLRHGEMALRHRSHLRQMRYADRLALVRKRAKPRADRASRVPADA
jgi:hypothetical protein